MGCDIHIRAQDENFRDIGEVNLWRCYGIFGFLADVRNYSGITPLSKPRGLPDGMKEDDRFDYHSHSWLSVKELVDFNYDAMTEDRRCTRQTAPNCYDGGCTCEPGEGKKTTYREFLGEGFFDFLKELQDMTAARIVFWFDS